MGQDLPTSPHLLGIWIASLSALILALVSRRKQLVDRLPWPRRVVWAVAAPILVAIAVLGNGVQGIAERGVLTSGEIQSFRHHRDLATLTWMAMDVVLAPAFVEYYVALDPQLEEFELRDFQNSLTLWVLPYERARSWGFEISPPPGKSEHSVLAYRYYDVDNVALNTSKKRRQQRSNRYQYLTRTRRVLDELVTIELYRNAHNDPERLFALEQLSQGTPFLTEWLMRDLDFFSRQKTSPRVLRKLRQTQAYLRRYIDDPTLRGLPKDTSVELGPPGQAQEDHEAPTGDERTPLSTHETRLEPSRRVP